MEIVSLPADIKVFYVTAVSFPNGIADAHERLHALVPHSPGRKYFGISRPENGSIVYKAAAEEISPGEAETFKCDTLILKSGKYICLKINNYMEDLRSIDRSFKTLLSYPGLDPDGYCVEWYLNDKDVNCIIRLKDS